MHHDHCLVCGREHPDQPRVCGYCRSTLDAQLAELPELLNEATRPAEPFIVRRWHYEYVGAELGCANRIIVWNSVDVPAGPTRPASRDRISGSRTAPLPVSVEVLDLVGPGAAHVTDLYSDQVGELPPAVWLDQWVSDWAEMRGERLPVPVVPQLVAWLRVRLDWACDVHDAIDEFADELRRQHGRVRALAQGAWQKTQLCEGVACPKCDLRALYRQPGDYRIRCGGCPHLMTEEEYQAEVKRQAKLARAS